MFIFIPFCLSHWFIYVTAGFCFPASLRILFKVTVKFCFGPLVHFLALGSISHTALSILRSQRGLLRPFRRPCVLLMAQAALLRSSAVRGSRLSLGVRPLPVTSLVTRTMSPTSKWP